MVLKRADEPAARVGVAGMRTIIRALIAADMPLVFGPGAIHLPTVPDHRKWNRVDLGTADKVASAALGIVDQAERLGIPYDETSFAMLELGGGFSAALAVDAGQIVDGFGGSAGPIGARACGALDGEAAYLIGGALSKRTLFSGGALDPARGRRPRGAGSAARAAGGPPRARGLARARGGRREGRAGAHRVRAGAAGDPRVRSPGLGARAPRSPRAAARARGAGPSGARRQERGARARRSSPTAWRAARTRRSSRACVSATRAAACSTTCGCTARSGSRSASTAVPVARPATRPPARRALSRRSPCDGGPAGRSCRGPRRAARRPTPQRHPRPRTGRRR